MTNSRTDPHASTGRKVFIKTFGCQMNEYDSDKMLDVLHAAEGYEQTTDVEQADLILFNTCSVREKAQEKVFSDLGRVKHLKKKGVLIGVGGCVASQEGEAIVARAPYVDVVFGPQTLHRLPEMIVRRLHEQRPQVDISFPEIEKFDHLPPARVQGASAFVSIMEGCSKYCSYCVVPYTRGEEVSRPLDDVLVEVAELAGQGVREVTLLGQNVNGYRGAMGARGEIADFALLLDHVAEIPGIERIRYTTSHPNEFGQRLIDAYARLPQLVDHVHLPVQHGSDRILMAMKRGYTAMEFKSTVRKLRLVRPNIRISSDFIVGFPGETDADFDRTMQLIDDVGFDNSFSFVFSPCPGTPAAALADPTPQAVKLHRLQTLQAAIDANARRIGESLVGSMQRILVEGPARKLNGDIAELMGRTECNRVVNFPAGALSARLTGQLIDIRITESRSHSLRGRLDVELPAAADQRGHSAVSISLLRRVLLGPWWALQLLTSAKSFCDNPIIGSPRLNALGLHRWRLRVAHALTWRRRQRLARLISAADRAAFERDGFVLHRDLLSRPVFERLRERVLAHPSAAREMAQGDTITRRIAIDDAMLRELPELRALTEHPVWSGLTRYVAGYHRAPWIYLQTILNQVLPGHPDPQTVPHADTFHPTMKAWFFMTDVAEDEGAFCYVPGSHRLTPERLEWEGCTSVRARDADRLSARGSFRVDAAELPRLNLPPPRCFAVPANTLIVADTFGFHARGPSARPSVRIELWGYDRRNPFLPSTTDGLIAAMGLTGRRAELYWRLLDALERVKLGRNPWRDAGVKTAGAPAGRSEPH